MRCALAIDKASYGSEHPKVARDLNNLAQLLKDTNRPEEAEPLIRQALAIDEESYGPKHRNVSSDLYILAQVLEATDRPEEAEPQVRRALAIDEASYGPKHPNVARDLTTLAQVLEATNRTEEAEPLIRRALLILLGFARDTGHPHPSTSAAFGNYRTLLVAMSLDEEVVRERIASLGTEADFTEDEYRKLLESLEIPGLDLSPEAQKDRP